ncbi:MAG: hypothetical protein IKB82_00495 [Clostridia bacterium]|nr:hypothetical protein [Clostridia bacterium]
MNIIHKNEGPKIPYEVFGNKICFDDDLTINLAKREDDWPVHIDVCHDADGELVIGAAAGRAYVAEIDIPKREYIEVPAEEPVATGDEGMGGGPTMEPVPFDIDRVTLTLWAVE